MLAEQRADIILHELSALRTVSVSHLCQLTGASEATIRRDLNTLANLGKLSKVRGGATLAETEEVFGKMPESSRLHLAEKDRIARYAASLITNDDVVYLDAGSTVMQMVEYLQNSRALFMTNSIEAACRLMAPRATLQVIVPATARTAFLTEASARGLWLVRRSDVVTVPGKAPKRTLLHLSSGRPDEAPAVDELPLCGRDGRRSPEYDRLTHDFYL